MWSIDLVERECIFQCLVKKVIKVTKGCVHNGLQLYLMWKFSILYTLLHRHQIRYSKGSKGGENYALLRLKKKESKDKVFFTPKLIDSPDKYFLRKSRGR